MIIKTVFLFTLVITLATSETKINKRINFTHKGPLASVFTPFNNDIDRSLNLSVVPEYATFLASKNVTGVLVAGTMGEAMAMTVDERKKLAEVWASVAKETKQHLMIHVGGVALKNVKELATHAESIGADSLLILPDFYAKPVNTEHVINYMQLVSEFAPKTPLLYYHNDNFGIDIDIEKFLKNVGSKVPTFAGIKLVTTDVVELMDAWANRGQYTVYIGTDEAAFAGCVIGLESMVMSTTTFVPELNHEVLKFCRSSNGLDRARDAQRSISKIVREIYTHGGATESMKVATSMVANLPLGPPRAPLKALRQEDIKAMAQGLTKLGLKIHDIAV